MERPPAGGHSAPPRGRMQLDVAGEPVYAHRDEANLANAAEMHAVSGGVPPRRRLCAVVALWGPEVHTVT